MLTECTSGAYTFRSLCNRVDSKLFWCCGFYELCVLICQRATGPKFFVPHYPTYLFSSAFTHTDKNWQQLPKSNTYLSPLNPESEMDKDETKTCQSDGQNLEEYTDDNHAV